MSALDDITAAIEAIGEKIEEAVNATRAVDAEVDEASGTASALGASATVEGPAELSSQLSALAQQLGAAAEQATTAAETARGVAENT